MIKKLIKNKNIILSLYIILHILYVNIGCLLIKYKVIKLKYYSKTLISLLILNYIVIAILLTYRFINKKKKRKIKVIDILLIIIIILSIISVTFAIDTNLALYGSKGRYEGLYSILYYFSVYFISTYIDKKYKKNIIYIILLCGFIQALYAILQICEKNLSGIIVIKYYKQIELWANGFISNPNFFGTYMLICLSYSIGLYIDNKRLLSNIIYIILIIIFMIAILISNALSALIGLFGVLLYLLIYIIKEKKYLKYIIVFIALLSTTIVIDKCQKTTLIEDLNNMLFETNEIAKGNAEDIYGTKRIYIWKQTLSIVPKYIIHGVGIDNFTRAFNNKALIRKRYIYGKVEYDMYDKTHNEYLQILITEGIFALIAYLLLYGYIITKSIKNSFKSKEVYLILPIIGHLIQAFFNISVIEVAPIFYISLGLCVDRSKL